MIIFINEDTWNMNINLEYVCEHAGKREYWIDTRNRKHPYVPFTIAHAKKILKLVYTSTLFDEEQQEKIKGFLASYPKMLNIWETIK